MLVRFLCVMMLITPFVVHAEKKEVSEQVEKQIRSSLAAALPALEISSVSRSPVEGLYEVASNNEQPLLVSASGEFIVAGEIYQLNGHKVTNLSEQKREVSRAEIMAAVPESEKMSFVPDGETKARITVFTDIDCGYCRKLHKEVPKLNAMGVQVDYLAYPRAGVGSKSYDKVVSAWCADDPQSAMTKAKSGQVIPAKTCANPVARHLALGQRVGVSGTPAIVLDSGKLVPGYAPAEALVKQLGLM